MSPLETIVTSLLAEIDRIVDHKIDERLPELFRDLEAAKEPDVQELVGALEVAKLLGRDVSTPKDARLAKQNVYNLARQRLIPSVRISRKCLRFDLTQIRKLIERGGNA